MQSLTSLLAAGTRSFTCRPWPRAVLDPGAWSALAAHLAQGRFTLVSLWGDVDAVHMALLDEASVEAGIATCLCPEGRFPSVGQVHPPAQRLERAVRDLYGHVPEAAPDTRPWLDHGRWGIDAPLGAAQAAGEGEPYAFLAAEGAALHQIPVGPVHAGIIEPGHFRFTCHGETVVRLEARLGYVHKGIEGLMVGASVEEAARLAGRSSGDSTVAFALAFARAVEAARGIGVPPRAIWLRALAAELERLANHFGDVGAICNDAAFALMLAHCGVLRERTLRAAQTAFGNRLMMDVVIPGGLSNDMTPDGIAAVRALVKTARATFPELIRLYDDTTSIQDRTVGTGIVREALARRFGAGGFVGRASGRSFDARRFLPYPPYNQMPFTIPSRQDGDVNARIWIRIQEIEESLSLVTRLLDTLPAGPTQTSVEPGPGEGVAMVEGFRGDIFAYVRLDREGRMARAHLRDPSWFQWPLLEAAIEGNIVADFPLCNKSFNCSYAGHDL
ncbi:MULTISPECIES: NADH-quinone oxidoreductase subunit C [unclassified Xanthobacter]|uniref:hydrogenase large subunit n=1 Tax=unclassified Xanthobacter TaxID=2623496 RepID=UPI001F3B27E4|nr:MULTISPECIES: NADH-quinone oxidoreductase subunit C [unclassified Xanthobacter]